MSYRLTGILSFLAAALLAPAAAQAASPGCSGGTSMVDSAREGRTTIVRSGTGHTAMITRTDPDGTVHLEQHGQDHATLAVQSGDGSKLAIDQRGASAAIPRSSAAGSCSMMNPSR